MIVPREPVRVSVNVAALSSVNGEPLPAKSCHAVLSVCHTVLEPRRMSHPFAAAPESELNQICLMLAPTIVSVTEARPIADVLLLPAITIPLLEAVARITAAWLVFFTIRYVIAYPIYLRDIDRALFLTNREISLSLMFSRFFCL